MFCVAYMIFAAGVAETFAIALLFKFMNTKQQQCIRTCVFSRCLFFVEYGLNMLCVACMISASDVGETIAIALLFHF